MMDYACREGLALIRLQGSEENRLSEEWVEALARAIDAYQRDAGADLALLFTADGASFSRGADAAELGLTYNSDAMRMVTAQMRKGRKPVVAWLQGKVWGGGAELALACDWLLAAESLDFALPEIRRGLPPGAGATQYLPRRIGVAAAWSCLASGDSIDLSQARMAGLVDAQCDSLQAAVAATRRLGQRQARRGLEASGFAFDLVPSRVQAEILRAPLSQRDAMAAIIESMRAGSTDFEIGYARELELYRAQEASPQRQSLHSLEQGLSFSRSRWGQLPRVERVSGSVALVRAMGSQDSVLAPPAEDRELPAVWMLDPDHGLEYRCLDRPRLLSEAGLVIYAGATADAWRDQVLSAALSDAPRLQICSETTELKGIAGGCFGFSYGGSPCSVVQLANISVLDPQLGGTMVALLAQNGVVVIHDGGTHAPIGPRLLQEWSLAMQGDMGRYEALWTTYLAILAGEQAPPTEDWLSMADLALLNCSARMLDLGLAGNPQDLDAVLVFGYGLPAHHAPMLKALRHGLGKAFNSLQDLHARFGERFRPAPLLVRVASAR
ncbi:enoyl-CoA hydratase-related protein [Frateuria aurantia]